MSVEQERTQLLPAQRPRRDRHSHPQSSPLGPLALVLGLVLGAAAALVLGTGCGSSGDELRRRDDHAEKPATPKKPPPFTLIPAIPDFNVVELDPEGPWPVEDVVHYGPSEGLPGVVVGVGVDDAQNIYVIDGGAAYAMPVGATGFIPTSSGGQFELGYPVASVVGGGPGEVFLGFLAWEAAPEDLSEEDKLYGDVDRMSLMTDGSLELDFHYQLQNSNARWMDHTRSIFSLARVVGGPNHGDVYVGSNHGVTLIRGDEYADHRHAIFLDENGSEAIGYVWDVNTDTAGNLLFAGHWKVAALPAAPLDDVLSFVDYGRVTWLVDTHPEHLGPVEVPKHLHAVAGEIADGRVYVGSWGMGLSAMQMGPRKWWSIDGTPDSVINGLELDPTDGKLWVATGSSGLWRWDPATEEWEQSPFVPAGMPVNQIYLDTTVTPRALYAATNGGLYVIRAP